MTLTTCPRCDGRGSIKQFARIHDGLCFQCKGHGKIEAPKQQQQQPTEAPDLITHLVNHISPDEIEWIQFTVWHRVKAHVSRMHIVLSEGDIGAYGADEYTVEEARETYAFYRRKNFRPAQQADMDALDDLRFRAEEYNRYRP